MHPQRNANRVANPDRISALLLLVIYLVAGAAFTAVAFLVTDIEQFGCLFLERPLTPHEKLIRSLDLMFGFVVRRLLVGILVSAVLAWSLRSSLSKKSIAGLAVGIPVFAELWLARPWGDTWLGFLIAYVYSWPELPQHLTNIGIYIRTGLAYMIPPLFAGLALASAAIRLRDRFPRT